MLLRWWLAALALTSWGITHAQLKVDRITAENATITIPGGPDASGGLGDWWLSNGTICAVIADIDHETELSARGGVLVDLGFCDRNDDHFVSSQDLLDGSRRSPIDIDRIRPVATKDSVSIATIGSRNETVVETSYTLDLDTPTRLRISKTIRASKDRESGFGLYTPVVFNHHSMEPFLFDSRRPAHSRGFVHQEFSERGTSAIRVAPSTADTIIFLSAPDADPGISYGWRLRSAIARDLNRNQTEPLPVFSLADAASTAFLVLPETFTIGDGTEIGWLQLPQLALMEHDSDTVLQLEEEVWVGRAGHAASITDQLIEGGLVRAQTDESRLVVHVDQESGAPLTQIRPDPTGSLRARLPVGRYRLRVRAPGGREYQRTVSVPVAGVDLGQLELEAPTRVLLPQGHAMRLVFRGRDGTPDPSFGDSLSGLTIIDDHGSHLAAPMSADVFLAGVESDPQSVDVAPGSYRVYATRGLEYAVEQTDLRIAKGQQLQLTIEPPARTVSTPGFIAADLHVHSGASMDSAFSSHERVRTFVAEHGEVMVASEHETLFDFQPVIDAMGVGDRLIAINGTEATSLVMSERLPHTAGHLNFFPLQAKPLMYRRGAPPNENLRLREMLHDLHKLNPTAVAQLNHPRSTPELAGKRPRNYADLIDAGAYFEHLGPAAQPFDPALPIDAFPNRTLIEPDPLTGQRDIDFHAMEIMNFAQSYHPERLPAIRHDWLALIKQGFRITATANSDSHHRAEQVALPRTMVAMEDDKLANFQLDPFLMAIKQGAVYGTTGPLIDIALSGVPMGGTLLGRSGNLVIDIRNAPWVSIDEARIQINGDTIETIRPMPKRIETKLEFTEDAFVTIELEGEAQAVYQAIYPGYWPYAYSNPIYVDADRDGHWTPPGL